MPKQSIVHVLRAPLPWRPSRLTECGLLSEKVIAKAELLFEIKDDAICKTCWERSRYRYRPTETPLEREIAWSRTNRQKDRSIDFELKAIGELVEQHREDFDRMVAALQAEQSLQKVGG